MLLPEVLVKKMNFECVSNENLKVFQMHTQTEASAGDRHWQSDFFCLPEVSQFDGKIHSVGTRLHRDVSHGTKL